MIQFSVYGRVANGPDAVEKHKNRLNDNLPNNGSIRLLVVTEKQYESMNILVGEYSEYDTPFAFEQLSIF